MEEIRPEEPLHSTPLDEVVAVQKQPDSTADVEGATRAVSEDLSHEIRQRQEDIAKKQRRGVGNIGLLKKRIG